MDAGDRGSGLIIAKPLEEKDPGSPLRRADAPSPRKRNHAIVMDGRLADCCDARVVLALVRMISRSLLRDGGVAVMAAIDAVRRPDAVLAKNV